MSLRYVLRKSLRLASLAESPNVGAMPTGSAAFRRILSEIGTVDAVGLEERVAKYTTRSIKTGSKIMGLKLATTMVDLTTLEGKDTPGKVRALCAKALRPHEDADIPQVAAVCVYPAMVKHARKALGADAKVKIASVATAFPSGQAPLKTRLGEVQAAVGDGADEVDMVINRGAFLAGELGLVQDEIAAVLRRIPRDQQPALVPRPLQPVAHSRHNSTLRVTPRSTAPMGTGGDHCGSGAHRGAHGQRFRRGRPYP